MPKENKKRGRRDEKKRKRQEDGDVAGSPKRTKTQNQEWTEEEEMQLDEAGLGYQDDSNIPNDNDAPAQEFYGLLDEEEQAYFKRAAQMLELNEFVTGSAEERDAFIAGVWKECQDKELKVASSQSCSRLMEKLIQYATTGQLKSLFQSFSGHFTYLVQHRFASHCCEALFQRAAPLVTEESLTPFEIVTSDNQGTATSTESLFLAAVAELQGSFGYLMTDSFATHSVRILLLVLSGRPMTSQSTQSLLQSKKKETKNKTDAVDAAPRPVPSSFQEAFDSIIQDMIAHLDSNYLRALATNPLANPVLQLLLEIELGHASKQKDRQGYSLFSALLPDSPIVEGTDSARFIRGLMFDPVGSHLLETVIKNCPGKIFKPIWATELRPKLLNMVRNDSSIHVLARAMERLSPEDLKETIDEILPEIPSLLERLQYSLLKLMVERSLVRKLAADSVFDAITDYYSKIGIEKALKLDLEVQTAEEADNNNEDGKKKSNNEAKDPSKQRLSSFLQAMLDHDSSIRRLILDTFGDMDAKGLLNVSKDKYATFVLQQSLALGNKVYRKVVIQKLASIVMDLAIHEVGSHVLDSIWKATMDLQFLRERVAQQLASNENEIKDSYGGRFVWRSWMMDLYVRRKQSWIEKSKQADSLIEETPSAKEAPQSEIPRKSGIEAARERFAARQAQQKTGVYNARRPPPAAVA